MLQRAKKRNGTRCVQLGAPDWPFFVPDNDPLRFYRRMAGSSGRKMLRLHRRLYFEINRAYREGLCRCSTNQGYEELRLIKDISGNDEL